MKMLLNGKKVGTEGREEIIVINPYTHEEIDRVPCADLNDIDTALECAREGAEKWGRVPVLERVRILEKVSSKIAEKKKDIALLLSKEAGKIYTQAEEEVDHAIGLFKEYANRLRYDYDSVLPSNEDMILVTREPLGVVACILPFNFPVELYGNMLVQSQCMAYSDDGIKFEKYSGNPVVRHPPAHEGEVSNFRDPKVIQAGDKYYMVVGSTTGGLKVGDGRIFLYVSDDLMHWQYKGILLKCNGEWTSMCECPDLFPLGNKWVLLFSLMHAVNAEKTVYAVGHMDFENCRFTIETTGELDYGMDYYAAQTMLDPKGRRLVIAWQNSWEWLPWFNDFGRTEQENWRGSLSYPREISLGDDGKLRVYPVEELQTILYPEHTYRDLKITSERTEIASPASGAYCLKIHIDLSENRADVLKIGTKAYGDKATIISIDFEKCSVSLDRRNGDEVFIPKGKTTCLFNGLKENFEIMVLVDKCTVEFFVNKGETGMTCTVFPALEEQKLWLQTGKGDISIEKLDISEIHL